MAPFEINRLPRGDKIEGRSGSGEVSGELTEQGRETAERLGVGKVEGRLLDDPGHCSATHAHRCTQLPGHDLPPTDTDHRCLCGLTWRSTTGT
jgi:hypothetical protein